MQEALVRPIRPRSQRQRREHATRLPGQRWGQVLRGDRAQQLLARLVHPGVHTLRPPPVGAPEALPQPHDQVSAPPGAVPLGHRILRRLQHEGVGAAPEVAQVEAPVASSTYTRVSSPGSGGRSGTRSPSHSRVSESAPCAVMTSIFCTMRRAMSPASLSV
jgi:hypothetical protein